MKPTSTKKKGNRYENYLIEVLRERLDSKAQRTYGSGNGLDKQDIKLPNFNFEIECKNSSKQVKLIEWWEQCKRQEYGPTGVLMIRNPRKAEFQETLVVMGLDEWIELMKKQNETVEVETNFKPELKWKIKRLKDAAQAVFKDLEQ
jgi:hypothetical protein